MRLMFSSRFRQSENTTSRTGLWLIWPHFLATVGYISEDSHPVLIGGR